MSSTERERARVRAAERAFAERYGRAPEIRVRAPGRVNLIGEHTDYNGLPVLPMAVERSVLLLAAPRSDRRVTLASMQPGFAPRTYQLEEAIAPFAPGDWGNYHKAAAQGLITSGAQISLGEDVLVDGDIPPGAGLSSSAALVVASALGLLAANGCAMDPISLAECTARAEQYVGTLSGGMDQAACLLGRAGHALRIDFHPLRARPVPVPAGCSFVVCDSLVTAEKSGAARVEYNRRVAECRLATHLLSRLLGRSLACLGDLARLFPDVPLAGHAAVLARVLPERDLSLEEIAAAAGEPGAAVAAACSLPAGGGRYSVLRRSRHVLNEAMRVDAAEAALAGGDVKAFGALMNESHASCRDDYEISCPELEELVDAARRSGALGARLTGAGFGGCTVNLVAKPDVAAFVAGVEKLYYASRSAGRQHCFVFHPQPGARVEHAGDAE